MLSCLCRGSTAFALWSIYPRLHSSDSAGLKNDPNIQLLPYLPLMLSSKQVFHVAQVSFLKIQFPFSCGFQLLFFLCLLFQDLVVGLHCQVEGPWS